MPDIHELAQHMKDAHQELLALSEITFDKNTSEKVVEKAPTKN